jgi:DNA polymerase III subunit delta'
VVSPAFERVIGQPLAVELLTQAIVRQRLAPAYLFAGPEGVGRRLTALSFLAAILSQTRVDQSGVGQSGEQRPEVRRDGFPNNHPDLLWVEPTYLHQGKLLTRTALQAKGEALPKTRPQIRLEQIREIARFLGRPPWEAARSLVVIEQAETMAEAAANGLLKTLEEPGRASLILMAPSPSSLLPTLVSRCQCLPFYRLEQPQMHQVLTQNGLGELWEHPELIQMAQGSPGAAIAHWQKWQQFPPELLATYLPPPPHLGAALERGRQISQTLELEAQLWLVDFLQQSYWRDYRQPALLHILEQTRQHLLAYAQPQLVWEVTWMSLAEVMAA